jgi:hypothetical protein
MPYRLATIALLPCLILACTKEVPPRSVAEFVDNPILLEATMVRCAQNRAETKYDAECVNAREAVNRIEVLQDQARRAEFEALSEQKRQALRRTQEAAAEARRRANEAQQPREEATYLGQFDALPAAAQPDASKTDATSHVPGVQTPQAPAQDSETAAPPPADSAPPADLEAIREELKRRQDQPQ